MKKAINILVVIGMAIPLTMGLVNIFAPLLTFEQFGIKPISVMTYSTFRGLVGGMLTSAGLMMLIGLITRNKTWYQASLLTVAVILFSRIISIIMDGWTNELIPVLIAESFNLILLPFAIKQLETYKK